MIGAKKLLIIKHLELHCEAAIDPSCPSFYLELSENYSCNACKSKKNSKLCHVHESMSCNKKYLLNARYSHVGFTVKQEVSAMKRTVSFKMRMKWIRHFIAQFLYLKH